jgi:hypothetical protein
MLTFNPAHRHLLELPNEILHFVANYLSIQDILVLSMTCHKFKIIFSDPSVWKGVSFSLMSNIYTSSRLAHIKNCRYYHLGKIGDAFHKYLLIYYLPSSHFLKINRISRAFRFSCIRSLILRGCGEFITDFYLKDDVLPCLPNLQIVDFSGLYMIGDGAMTTLLTQCGHSLKHLNLAKCFGIGLETMKNIGKYCKSLRYLNIGEGCGGVYGQGITKLVKRQDTSTEEGITPTDLCFTLEVLIMNQMDFISEDTLVESLGILTSIPPINSNLKHLDVSRTFAITNNVLGALYSSTCLYNVQPIEGGMKSLEINLERCDQLMEVDVKLLKKNLVYKKSNDPKFANIVNISISHSCKLYDDSYDSIASYIKQITESSI